HILLLARTAPRDPAKPFAGLTLFFTEFDRARIAVREIEKLGRAAVDSNEIFIDGLEIPEANVVGEVGRGFYHLLDSLNPERVFTGIEAVGIGRAALDRAVQYAKERVVFDRPIGQNQAIAHPLALAWAKLEAAGLMCMKAGWLFANGRPCGAESNTAKLLAAEAGFEACDVALQTHGGYGYAKEFYVERLWREVRLYKIAPVSQQMVLNHISEHVLGLPKSYLLHSEGGAYGHENRSARIPGGDDGRDTGRDAAGPGHRPEQAGYHRPAHREDWPARHGWHPDGAGHRPLPQGPEPHAGRSQGRAGG